MDGGRGSEAPGASVALLQLPRSPVDARGLERVPELLRAHSRRADGNLRPGGRAGSLLRALQRVRRDAPDRRAGPDAGDDGSVTCNLIESNPVEDTGMRSGNKTVLYWREGKRYYFYYVSEEYPNTQDPGEVSDDFETFSSTGTGGGGYDQTEEKEEPEIVGSRVKRYGPIESIFTSRTFTFLR